MTCSGATMSVERYGRKPRMFPNKPSDRGDMGAGERVGGHACAKWRELRVGLAHHRCPSVRAEPALDLLDQLCVERRQAIEQRLPGVAANAAGSRARGVELLRDTVEQR